MIHLLIFEADPAREVLNVGYSWPGVFLLGASGRTGRFFTQLLFHNPHSILPCFGIFFISIFYYFSGNYINLTCVCHHSTNKCHYLFLHNCLTLAPGIQRVDSG